AHLKDQSAPPLEYYVKLLLVWRDTMEKYQLPAPPGYGEPGVGKAVFSVSAFMDVIRS
ncbi:MAG: radical SAM protein, partial [Deltaproteobacteria bacterium]|nr:radical SAM protein [Deltaproteobacteria bacterium]